MSSYFLILRGTKSDKATRAMQDVAGRSRLWVGTVVKLSGPGTWPAEILGRVSHVGGGGVILLFLLNQIF